MPTEENREDDCAEDREHADQHRRADAVDHAGVVVAAL